MQTLANKKLRPIIYLAAFFITLVTSLASYTNSSFLSLTFGEELIGLIYTIGGCLTILATFFIPKIIKIFKLKLTTILLISLVILGLSILILKNYFWLSLIGFGFVIYYSFSQVARYNTDLYLESVTTNNETGGVRGTFMTIINLAWLFSPALAGYILGVEENFSLLYLTILFLLIPFIFIFGIILPEQDVHTKQTTVKKVVAKFTNNTNHNLQYILLIDFLLNIFFALMVIYMPLLLHNELGFSWPEIGFIFSLMLIPFVIIEYPLGKIVDKWLIQKELLITGFTVIGLSTFILGYIESNNIYWWAILLFITRVGAAIIEIMKETSLFKEINKNDGLILSFSRNMVPFSFIIAPTIATVCLLFGNYQDLFLILGIVMLIGLYPSLKLVSRAH